jgi:hypothetical protein
MVHDVFISHSHHDKPVADAACAALEAKGIRCWIAPRDIDPGQDWATSIVQAIRGCQIMLLVFSGHANQSPQVQREVERAASSRKVLLPLRIDEVSPEAALEYYLGTPHWLDAITPPFEAHLEKLAAACAGLLEVTGRSPQGADQDPAAGTTGPISVGRATPFVSPQLPGHQPSLGGWRRQRQGVKVALSVGFVVVVAAVAGVTGLLLQRSPAHEAAPSPTPVSAPPATSSSFVAPAPVATPAGSVDPRAQIVQLTGAWSEQGFVDAIISRDTRIVALYLQSGLKATTLHNGASAILFGFQGVPQNGDPVELLKTFQAAGFKVDDALEDNSLMAKLGHGPQPFDTPLTPKGYVGGGGGTFVGSLLFWIVQRALWAGPNDQDIQVINYLTGLGADCKVPLSYLQTAVSYMNGDSPYQTLLPMMQSCAK